MFSQLKVRASYGSLGNQLVGEYGYIPAMSSTIGSYMIGGKIATDRFASFARLL